MPLKLIPPRPGKSPNWSVRGTYLGCYVEKSAGTPDKALASKFLHQARKEIEAGRHSATVEPTKPSGPSFLSAAVDYIENGGDARFLGRYDEATATWSGLIAHFGEKPIEQIDQAAISEAAKALLPNATPQTVNRQIYTPISAVLKAAGIDRKIKRPKGWRGSKATTWLKPEQAFKLFAAADSKDREFGIFIRVLTYTGMRLSECTGMKLDQLELADAFVYVPTTKNGEPRGVHLPPILVAEIASHPRGLDRKGDRVFRFRKCGRLYTWLDEVLEAAGIELPPRSGFHVLRHSWATWMRRYGKLDTRGLVGTGAWKDEKSAERYEHVIATEEARRADRLPVEPGKRSTRGKSVERAAKAS